MPSWQRQGTRGRQAGRQAGSRGINTLGPWDLSSGEGDWGRGAKAGMERGVARRRDPAPPGKPAESLLQGHQGEEGRFFRLESCTGGTDEESWFAPSPLRAFVVPPAPRP